MATATRWTDSIHEWVQKTIQESTLLAEVTYELFITLRLMNDQSLPNSPSPVQVPTPVATLLVMAPSPLLNAPPLVVVGDFPVTTKIQESLLAGEIKKMLVRLAELQSRALAETTSNVTQLFPPLANPGDAQPLHNVPRIP